MKTKTNLITLTFCVLTTLSSMAQKKIGSYQMAYFDKELEVQANEPKNDVYSLYIEAYPRESSIDEICLIVRSKKQAHFNVQLSKLRNVYTKWKETAIENKITDLDKEIEMESMSYEAAFFYGSKWKFDFSVRLKARFRVISGKYLLILSNRNDLVASDNQYMNTDGFYIILSSQKEIDALIKQLHPSKVTDFYAKETQKTDIFKQ